MVRVLEIRKVLLSLLKEKHPRVYYEQASKDTSYPYVVFLLSDSIDTNQGHEQFVLDIDGWDNNKDTTELETMMDAIDKNIHRKTVTVNGEITMTIYRDNRLSIEDEEKGLRRRKYVYQIRVHE